MRIKIEVDAEKVLQAFRRAPVETARELRVEMKDQMTGVAIGAERVHRFIARTGFLERAITPLVDRTGLIGRVFIDAGLAPYGIFVHKGHGTWEADKFLTNSFKRRTNEIISGLLAAIQRAFKIAGLK